MNKTAADIASSDEFFSYFEGGTEYRILDVESYDGVVNIRSTNQTHVLLEDDVIFVR